MFDFCQQFKKLILEFLQSVLYIPIPKIIAPKIANGKTINNLDFRPTLKVYQLPINSNKKSVLSTKSLKKLMLGIGGGI